MKNTNDSNGNRTSDLHLVTCAPSLHRTAVNIFVTSTVKCMWDFTSTSTRYRGADKSLARPGRETSSCFCQNGVNFPQRLALQGKQLDDRSRPDIAEIARVPDMLPSLFPSWSV